MLGAVRHHNIIPWDDDIDVFMPRKDYEELLTLAQKMEADGFRVISAKTTSSFATFAKIYNKDTTLWELESIPFVYGVYIDIFPLDETSLPKTEFLKNYRTFRNLFRKYQLSQMKFSFRRLFNDIKDKDKKMIVKGIASLFIPSFLSEYFRKKIIMFENRFSKEKGDHLVSYYGDYWGTEYFDKKWFNNYEDVPFSDFTVKIPAGYHEYLSNVYGDYMKFPPVEKRASQHYHYYLNMDKGMTLEEVLQVLKNKE
jgi:lipopolysaccharide cholinephosphotransferase